MQKIIIWALVLVVLIGGASWASKNAKQKRIERESAMTSREAALLCTTDMATQFHIHPELSIFINGEQQEIPANIGVTSMCMNSLHTHDANGTLHVESPVQKDFTIGDFFAVWKKDFSKDKILDSAVTSETTIEMTVNGAIVDTYENTILKDKDKIVITYKKK